MPEHIPVGIATAVRGNSAFPMPNASAPMRIRPRCRAVSGRTRCWRSRSSRSGSTNSGRERIAAGDEDFVSTFGKFSTDSALHAMTKVPGEVAFSLNIGAASKASQDEARGFILDLVTTIETSAT